MSIFLVLYLTVFLIEINSSISCFNNFQRMKQATGTDLFEIKPQMKRYLILKPIFWPWFFVTEKNPIERLSELCFKHYGDEGHTYFGSKGLKNFLNDVVRGKNRYKHLNVKKLLWPIDKNGREYQEHPHLFKNDKNLSMARIICAEYNGKYLLNVVFGNRDHLSISDPVSRFDLDDCQKLSKSEFKQSLLDINPTKAQEWFENSLIENQGK